MYADSHADAKLKSFCWTVLPGCARLSISSHHHQFILFRLLKQIYSTRVCGSPDRSKHTLTCAPGVRLYVRERRGRCSCLRGGGGRALLELHWDGEAPTWCWKLSAGPGSPSAPPPPQPYLFLAEEIDNRSKESRIWETLAKPSKSTNWLLLFLFPHLLQLLTLISFVSDFLKRLCYLVSPEYFSFPWVYSLLLTFIVCLFVFVF